MEYFKFLSFEAHIVNVTDTFHCVISGFCLECKTAMEDYITRTSLLFNKIRYIKIYVGSKPVN
jgi:hypothetical protein